MSCALLFLLQGHVASQVLGAISGHIEPPQRDGLVRIHVLLSKASASAFLRHDQLQRSHSACKKKGQTTKLGGVPRVNAAMCSEPSMFARRAAVRASVRQAAELGLADL